MIYIKNIDRKFIIILETENLQSSEISLHGAGHRKRLRQRFETVGIQGLSEHEVVELLLTVCIPRKDVKLLAKKLLHRFRSVTNILHASREELREFVTGDIVPFTFKLICTLHEIMLNDTENDQSQYGKLNILHLIKFGDQKDVNKLENNLLKKKTNVL